MTVLVERKGCFARFRHNDVERIESVPLHEAVQTTVDLYGDGDRLLISYKAEEVVTLEVIP